MSASRRDDGGYLVNVARTGARVQSLKRRPLPAARRLGLVISLAAARRATLLVEVDVGQRLPVGADAARTGGAPMLMTVEEM